MGASPASGTVDGRAARAERTRTAVADALLDLLTEGELRPTSARIAERAGVSVRSVFQHFEDREALLSAVGARQVERIIELIGPLPVTGPLASRARHLVAQRARVYEFMAPVRRAAALQEPFSPALRSLRDRLHAQARDELARVFAPELQRGSAARRHETAAALDAATSWETWDLLRSRRDLPAAAAARVMTRMITALLS